MHDPATLPEHIRKPQLRPIQPVPVQKDGKQLVALRDPSMLCPQTMIVPPQAMAVLQQFRGERSIEQIAAEFSGDAAQFAELAKGLDQVGLLWGPTAERLEEEQKARLRAHGAFPAGAAGSMGSDAAACRSRMDAYFEQTEDPELDGEVRAIVAPHLDYDRGWPNYAAAYYMLRDASPPDRVVVLGTNHFGIGDGAVATEYGFDTPLGRCPVAGDLVAGLTSKLGDAIIVDQLDHLGEHSIQLQLPWLQHCFGEVPILAVLLPDPLVPPIEDDGRRVGGDELVDALRDVMAEAGGRTLLVGSCDLSHVGPQFGEPRAVDEQRRIDVEQHDRDMLSNFLSGDAEAFMGALRWNRNPTRWCSIGTMSAMLRLVEAEAIELIDYRQAFDERGSALVSSASMVML